VNSQNKKVVIKNNSDSKIVDYTLKMQSDKISLPLGQYIATYKNSSVPVELSVDLLNKEYFIIPIDKIDAGEEIEINIKKGVLDSYPKRSYAELAHKIGGKFEGPKYEGGFSWVKPNYMSLPGNFRDHSYYIKYEGPGWENDKVAFRFYLDNRNAIDVFAKRTSDIVLPAVGTDGYDNYHNMADWGMDNMKVEKALGIGSIAFWDGLNALKVEKKDSLVCFIPSDGKIQSQVKTLYYGWDVDGKETKCDLFSLISIDAGSRASRMELLVDKNIGNLCTGIIKMPDTELIKNDNKTGEWSYFATFGKQSLNNDMQGLAIFYRTKQLKEFTGDDLNHVVVLTPENGYVEYYFMPTWEMDKEPVKTKDDFMKCINEVLNRLNETVSVIIN
jgi:hypothetical protein